MKCNIREKDVIRALRKSAKEKVVCDEMQKDRIIANVTENEIPIRKWGSFGEFLMLQFSFINKLAFLGQALWLVVFFYMMWDRQTISLSNEALCILSMAPPLLLLLTVEEISRIYNRSMLEIEYATKYSLRKVVMTRLFLLGTMSFIVLCVGILFAKLWLKLDLISVLLYSLTPYVCMTFLLLLLMEKWKGQQLKYGGVSVYVALATVILIGRLDVFHIYQRNFLWVWTVVLTLSLFGIMYQLRKLWFRLECFELVAE